MSFLKKIYSVPFSIRYLLRYGIVMLVAGSVIVVGGLTTWLNYQNQMQIVSNLKRSEVENAANEVGFFLSNLKDPLDYLALLPGVTGLSPDQQLQFLQGIVESNDAYFSIAIVQKDGTISSAITPFSLDREKEVQYLINDSGVSWQKIIETGSQSIGTVTIRQDQNLSTITIGLPMRDRNGDVSGALITQIHLEGLGGIVNQVKVSETGYVYVLDSNDLVVAQTLRSQKEYQDFSGRRLVNSTLIDQVRFQSLDTSNLNEYQGIQRESVWGASSKIYAVDWLVVVELPTEEINGIVRRSLLIAGLVLLGAGGIAISAGLLLSRSILVPLQSLNQAAQLISAGNLETRVTVRLRNEFGPLANAFNLMAAQIRQSFQTLEQQNQDLGNALDELKNTQIQLIQTEKMSSLGRLVAGVAHEINNPINFVSGNLLHANEYSQSLLGAIQAYRHHYPDISEELEEELEHLDTDYIAEDFPQLLHSMHEGVERVRGIVKSLRSFSRLDESDSKWVDIHEGVDSTLIILKGKIKAAKYPVQIVKAYGKLPKVECYPAQLNQVIMNLIDNALHAVMDRVAADLASQRATQVGQSQDTITDATYRKAKIEIATDLEREPQPSGREWCVIRVYDNGMGIPQEICDRIFDPFFTTKPVGQGTGLGLSISYQIITETHQGKLTCDSVPGQGTEFIIRIPVSQRGAGDLSPTGTDGLTTVERATATVPHAFPS